jgi:FkbM family methyltransferase
VLVQPALLRHPRLQRFVGRRWYADALVYLPLLELWKAVSNMNGVIHVGGHFGEEVDGYLDEGRSPIILFEPQDLPHKHRVSSDVIWVQAALGDDNEIANLHIPQHLTAAEGMDTQSASLLGLIEERAVANGWVPTACATIPVAVMRFDQWARKNVYVRHMCTLLKIDVQGMEMQVLRGFGDYLKSFESIVVECSCPALYWGSYCAHDVEHELFSQGFLRQSQILRHGDVRFLRSL